MNDSHNSLEIESFEAGSGKSTGRFYYMNAGKKRYLSDFDVWMNEDLLPAEGEEFRNGIYRETE